VSDGGMEQETGNRRKDLFPQARYECTAEHIFPLNIIIIDALFPLRISCQLKAGFSTN